MTNLLLGVVLIAVPALALPEWATEGRNLAGGLLDRLKVPAVPHPTDVDVPHPTDADVPHPTDVAPDVLEREWDRRLPTAHEINEVAITWKAAENERFSHMTLEEVMETHGGCSLKDETRQIEEKPIKAGLTMQDLPAEFDARDKWSGCGGKILDQGQCGSCWAFGAVATLGFRFCGAAGIDVDLSPQELISCAKPGGGCGGGFPESAFSYMMRKGVRTMDCMPYVDGKKQSNASATTKCPRRNKGCTARTNASPKKYYADKYYTLATSTRDWGLAAAAIMQDLMDNGPIEVSFTVYSDFMKYRSGVYQHTMGKNLGGHAVMLVGWGVEKGTPYWLCQNSWGKNWGEQGLFKIVRQEDKDLGITVGAVSGIPKVSFLGRISREWPWNKQKMDA